MSEFTQGGDQLPLNELRDIAAAWTSAALDSHTAAYDEIKGRYKDLEANTLLRIGLTAVRVYSDGEENSISRVVTVETQVLPDGIPNSLLKEPTVTYADTILALLAEQATANDDNKSITSDKLQLDAAIDVPSTSARFQILRGLIGPDDSLKIATLNHRNRYLSLLLTPVEDGKRQLIYESGIYIVR